MNSKLTLPLWLSDPARRVLRVARGLRNRILMWLRRRAAAGAGLQTVIVLSLDKLGPCREVAKQAFEKGYFVHVYAPTFPVLEAQFAHGWSRLDPRTDFELAARIADTLNPVAILVEYKNLLLPMQAHLSDKLSLQSVGEIASNTSNSKIALRRALDEHDLVNLPWMLLTDYSEGKFAFPCVMKPDLGTASKGVRYVVDHNDLVENSDLSSALKDDPSVGEELLLEGFVEGRQFDLEGLAIDGVYYLLCVVEEFYEAAPPHFPPAWFLFNPPIEQSRLSRLWDATQKALRAVGVRNGGWHMEQRIDSDGEVFILDYANRMGYNQLISAASGINFAGTYVDVMTRQTATVPKRVPTIMLQLFAFDAIQLVNMKKLASEHPDCIHLQSYNSYEFSFHLYLGTIVVKFETFGELIAVLAKFDLVPAKIGEYYPDPSVAVPIY